MSFVLYYALLCAICLCFAEESVSEEAIQVDINRQFPSGDPRKCIDRKHKEIRRFEVLPGGGFDNLRNKDMGSVMAHKYSLCRTTDDGQYLIPDGVFTIPMKSSKVETFAELIEHWTDYTSTLSRSINVNAGLNLENVGISGSFSDEYGHMKSRQYYDKSMTARLQVRYVRYTAKMEPDTQLTDAFRNRLKKIAAHLLLNRTDLARYESQLIVRDFGTHVITSVDAGAALVKIDQLSSEFMQNKELDKSQILASASASFFGVFNIGAGFSQTTTKEMVDQYSKSRTSSNVHVFGGPVYRPENYTAATWSQDIANDMVALDVSGDPIYHVITEATLPDLPSSTIYHVYNYVKQAVDVYYKHNTHRGCTSTDSPNFSFQANVDDGTCKPPNTTFKFGGVYQECDVQPGSYYTDLCMGVRQNNPLTGMQSCPSGYEAVLMQSGSKSSSEVRHECHHCHLFFHCCNNNRYYANAAYRAYWCVATGPVAADDGFLFGGLYTDFVNNPLTQSKSCPSEFYPLKLLDNLIVCVSDDYELGSQYSLPFAGFFSCHSGNPLAVNNNPNLQSKTGNLMTLQRFMLASGASAYPRGCPKGFSEHLAVVDDGCEINYCIKAGTLSEQALPKNQRPPFMPFPQDGYIEIDTSTLVFNDDGTSWTTMTKANATFGKETHETLIANATFRKEKHETLINHGSPITVSYADTSSVDGSGNTLSSGAIAGISIMATLACIIVGTILFVVIRRKRSRVYREADPWAGVRTPLNRSGPGYTQSLENPDTVVSRA